MFTKVAVSVVALMAAVGLAPAVARADDGGYEFKTFEVPEEVGTIVGGFAINNRGQLAATVAKTDDKGTVHYRCALQDNGTWTVLVPLGYTDSLGSFLNDKGEVALNIWDNTGDDDAIYFSDMAIYHNGRYDISTNIPGDTGNFNISGFNNRRQMTGIVWDEQNENEVAAFFFDGKQYAYFNYPGAQMTIPVAVNNSGVAVGDYIDSDGIYHAFQYYKGGFTLVDGPPGSSSSGLNGINNHGDMAGFYFAQDGNIYGYVLSGGHYTDVIYPGAWLTDPSSINDRGVITGWFLDSNNVQTFFIATPKHGKDDNGHK